MIVAAVFSDVTTAPIDVAALERRVRSDRAGAVVTFTGVVRDHDGGRGVTRIRYEAHPSAPAVLAGVAGEFAREGVHTLAVVHRVGLLEVGDVALVAVVAASHREEAFRCVSDLVDRVKEVVPVWKNQEFTDGTTEWTGLPGSLSGG